MKLSAAGVFRLRRVVSIVFGVFTIFSYAMGSFDYLRDRDIVTVLAAGLAAEFLVLCGGYLMNDLCDLPYDRINRPGSVYIGKTISADTARVLSLALLAAGPLLVAAFNTWAAAVVAAQSAALVFYNRHSKRMPFIKGGFISLLLVTIYPFSVALAQGGAPSPRRDSLFIFPVWLLLTTMAFELVRDLEDAPGDEAAGGKSLARAVGPRGVRTIASALALAAAPVAVLPYALGMCGPVYLAGALVSLSVMVVTLSLGTRAFTAGLHLSIVGVTLASLVDLAWRW